MRNIILPLGFVRLEEGSPVESVLKWATLRGHLKSSHIADKRKNFHMALYIYPLPPSSNESVTDNGRNIIMADGLNSPDLLQRSSFTTRKGVHQTLVIDRRCPFPMKSSFFETTCSNNVVCLTHAGALPWRLSVHCEKTRRQSRTVEEKYDFCSFSLFLHAQKLMAGVDLPDVETGASASAFNLAFKSAIDICRLTDSVCVHLPPSRSGSDPEHFFEIRCCKHRRAAHWWSRFFFFFLLSISQRNGSNPPTPPPPQSVYPLYQSKFKRFLLNKRF